MVSHLSCALTMQAPNRTFRTRTVTFRSSGLHLAGMLRFVADAIHLNSSRSCRCPSFVFGCPCFVRFLRRVMRRRFQWHAQVVRLLVEGGAAVDALDAQSVTPLMIAARLGHAELVRLLLDHGADADHANQQGFTALIWAIWQGKLEATRLLLERGARRFDLDRSCNSWVLTSRALPSRGRCTRIASTELSFWSSRILRTLEAKHLHTQFFSGCSIGS